MSWPESVDEVLCVGWNDGVRKRVDDECYTIRLTPRRTTSIWSAVNIQRCEPLIEAGRMQPAGMMVFAARQALKSAVYAYEQDGAELFEPYTGMLKRNKTAKAFFDA